jgi:RNA polymerase sigma-70 factor (ECF subfamily)
LALSDPTPAAPAFDPLADEVVAQLWRSLRRLGVPEASVPDAVQDALVVLHRRRDTLRPGVAPSTWVYGVALRVASDYRRKQHRAQRVFELGADAVITQAISDQPSPLECLANVEAARVVQAFLDSLVPNLREVFVLVELEELSLTDAAEALQISFSTCKGRLRSARQAFNAAARRERARQEREEAR